MLQERVEGLTDFHNFLFDFVVGGFSIRLLTLFAMETDFPSFFLFFRAKTFFAQKVMRNQSYRGYLWNL